MPDTSPQSLVTDAGLSPSSVLGTPSLVSPCQRFVSRPAPDFFNSYTEYLTQTGGSLIIWVPNLLSVHSRNPHVASVCLFPHSRVPHFHRFLPRLPHVFVRHSTAACPAVGMLFRCGSGNFLLSLLRRAAMAAIVPIGSATLFGDRMQRKSLYTRTATVASPKLFDSNKLTMIATRQ